MYNQFMTLTSIAIGCTILGIAYPLAAAAFYPFYKRMGGRLSFRRYMRRI